MGQSPPSSSYNSTADGLPFFQGKADFGDLHPKVRVFCNQPSRMAEPGDVLISVRAPVGPTNLVRERCCIGRGLAALRSQSELDTQFLLYFLRFREPRIAALGKGSTFEAINRDDLEDLELPLPDLPEQQRIAGILGRADRLRRTRRYAFNLSGTFLPAAFLELFGDRFHRGPFHRFGDLVRITGGGTPSRNRPEYFQGHFPWLTSKDMRGDYIWDTEEHITEDAIENSATHLVPANSILVVVKSKVLMHRLPVAIAKVPMCHGQDIKSIQCSKSLHEEFARFVLKHHERRLLNIARGANTEGLTLPMLEELPVPNVGFDEQQKFASLVERHERLRAAQREALRQAEHLFQSLLHPAFNGEL
jgi:type I restriction enzyme S subunit